MRGSGVTVLYTAPGPTLAALRAARRLRSEDGHPVRLVLLLPVPYPLPLSCPAVTLEFTEQRLRRLVWESSVTAAIEVFLCRDRFDALRDHLEPGSLVVVGARRRSWWGASERRLVKWLQQHGHSVVLAAPDEEAGSRPLLHHLLHIRMPNSSH